MLQEIRLDAEKTVLPDWVKNAPKAMGSASHGKLSADELTKAAADVKKASWTSLKERGVELIPRFVSAHFQIPRSSQE